MFAHTVAAVVGPAVAAGKGSMVRVKIVDTGAHIPPSSTVKVSVTVAPDAMSAALKLYVGVSVVPLMMNPVVADVLLAVHVILPLADEYPAGTVYTFAVPQTLAVLVAPAVATGSGVMVKLNVVLAGVQIPPSSTVMVSVTVAPDAISAALKL